MREDTFDCVVVGSGAGGRTVPARLAEAGHSVLVLEAGGDPRELMGGNALRDENCLPEDYDVPAFHACSTESRAIAWDYFVRHYSDEGRQRRDPECCFDGEHVKGILYPKPRWASEPAQRRSAGHAGRRLKYFENGSEGWEEDLASVVSGIKFVRDVMDKPIRLGVVQAAVDPPLEGMSDDALADFVRANAWGHYASSTCPIGPPDDGGVVDADFRVHGCAGLRIVDASIFPRIPGLFIVSAVYMIGEKAADAILRDARQP